MKDWSDDPAKGYKVLLGEGSVGCVEYYLIEQEGSRYSAMETVERCLQNLQKLRES